jgi:hypothetical protein
MFIITYAPHYHKLRGHPRDVFAAVLFIYFFQIFARRAKIWKNKSLYYLAAAGESGYQYATG